MTGLCARIVSGDYRYEFPFMYSVQAIPVEIASKRRLIHSITDADTDVNEFFIHQVYSCPQVYVQIPMFFKPFKCNEKL